MARMAHIRTVIVFFKALSSKKYDLINSGAYAALSCKGINVFKVGVPDSGTGSLLATHHWLGSI